jgi:hypothetical protein
MAKHTLNWGFLVEAASGVLRVVSIVSKDTRYSTKTEISGVSGVL